MSTTDNMPPFLLEKAIASVNEGITIADVLQPDCPLVYVNPGFERMTGYSKEEIVGKNCRFLQKNDSEQLDLEVIRRAIKNGTSCHTVLKNYKKDGAPFWNELNLSPIKDRHGKTTHFVGIQKDITNEKKYQLKIEHLFEHDQLTGLLNRHGFYSSAKSFYAWAQRSGLQIAVVMLDFDRFKLINDKHGHAAGDEMLAKYAALLQKHFRSNDVLARFGGDEFVILTTVTSDTEIPQLAERLKVIDSQITQQYPTFKEGCHVSYGICFPTDYDINGLDKAIKLADDKMYAKKNRN
jgi:diguanylate cyclase (GGDEF)-like protein/PAS domain S-box-containing protein